MADDIKETRQAYLDTLNDWGDARDMRAACMKALSGDPWKQEERDAREEAQSAKSQAPSDAQTRKTSCGKTHRSTSLAVPVAANKPRYRRAVCH